MAEAEKIQDLLGFFSFCWKNLDLKGTKTYGPFESGSGTPMFTVENLPYHKITLAGRTEEQAAIILCLCQTLAETLMTETQQSLLTNPGQPYHYTSIRKKKIFVSSLLF
jgi:hypothetical protein